MKALVTGACGFVGPILISHLHAQGDEVLGVVRTSSKTDFPSRQCDLLETQAVSALLDEFDPDVIYHLAGLSFIPHAENDFHKALALNVGITETLYNYCAHTTKRQKIFCVSSGAIYGSVKPEELPLTEESTLRPTNNYSLSKQMSELIPLRYENENFQWSVARSFNHIGPGQNDLFVISSFARQIARIFLGIQEPIVTVGNLDVSRDFTDVRDIVRGYRLAALKGQGIYNFCSGQAHSIRSILHTLQNIAGVKVEFREDPERMRAVDVPVVRGSAEKAYKELGWKPEIRLEDSLRDVFLWWVDQEQPNGFSLTSHA